MATARVRRAGRRPSLGREVGLWLLVAEDTRIALLLLNRGRHRLLFELFGVGPAQANLVTFAALLGLADAAQRRTAWLRAPGTPSPIGVAMGAATATAALAAVAGSARSGEGSNDLLLALSILHRLTAPATGAMRGVARAPWRLRSVVAGQAERLGNATRASRSAGT